MGLDQDVPVIGWVGRLSHEKGPDQLLEAVTKFSSPRPVTAVIGEGPLSGQLCQRATRLGLDDGSVRLMGQRGNAARLYQAFDLLVMSSRAEGTPLVLLEAMAAGIPVVCFAVGGIPDVIDNASGWLVPAGDIGALTYAIEHALSDRAEAEKRAAAAQQIFLERYSIQRYISLLGEFYRRVIPMVPS